MPFNASIQRLNLLLRLDLFCFLLSPVYSHPLLIQFLICPALHAFRSMLFIPLSTTHSLLGFPTLIFTPQHICLFYVPFHLPPLSYMPSTLRFHSPYTFYFHPYSLIKHIPPSCTNHPNLLFTTTIFLGTTHFSSPLVHWITIQLFPNYLIPPWFPCLPSYIFHTSSISNPFLCVQLLPFLDGDLDPFQFLLIGTLHNSSPPMHYHAFILDFTP